MAAITSQWWRRLVNAYKVKAGTVCLQCKNCVSASEVSFLRWGAIQIYRYVPLPLQLVSEDDGRQNVSCLLYDSTSVAETGVLGNPVVLDTDTLYTRYTQLNSTEQLIAANMHIAKEKKSKNKARNKNRQSCLKVYVQCDPITD